MTCANDTILSRTDKQQLAAAIAPVLLIADKKVTQQLKLNIQYLVDRDQDSLEKGIILLTHVMRKDIYPNFFITRNLKSYIGSGNSERDITNTFPVELLH